MSNQHSPRRVSTVRRRPVLHGLGAALAGSALVGTVGGTAPRGRNPFDTPNSNFELGDATSVTGGDDAAMQCHFED